MTTKNILCLRLNDGTELVGECESLETDLVVTNVLQLISVPDEKSQSMKLAIAPFMPYTGGEFLVPNGMAIVSKPSEDLENMHREKFGNIILPKTGKLIV